MGVKSLVLAASRFDFTSDDGKRIKGAKVQVMEHGVKREADKFGSMVGELNVSDDLYHSLQGQQLPGYYELEMGMVAGSKGAAKPTVVEARFLHAFAHTPAPAPAAKSA